MYVINKKNIEYPDINEEIVKSIVLNYKINKSVTLSSGKRSDYYYDVKSLLLNNITWSQIKDILISDLKSKFPGVVCVAGFGVGGVVLAMRIATCSGYGLSPIVIRNDVKEHGLLKQVEGHCPNGRLRTVIVDDVCTTGKNFRAAEKILRANGIKTLGNYVLLKRKESHFNCGFLLSI